MNTEHLSFTIVILQQFISHCSLDDSETSLLLGVADAESYCSYSDSLKYISAPAFKPEDSGRRQQRDNIVIQRLFSDYIFHSYYFKKINII